MKQQQQQQQSRSEQEITVKVSPTVGNGKASGREERRYLFLRRRAREKVQLSHLREDRELEEVANARRLASKLEVSRNNLAKSRSEAKKITYWKMVTAEQHSMKANMFYRGWLPWVRRVENAQLQNTKAGRYHQYSLMHCVWVKWMESVQRSRAANVQSRKNQVRHTKYVDQLPFLYAHYYSTNTK